MSGDDIPAATGAGSFPRSPIVSGPSDWPRFAPGTSIEVVKRAPGGAVVATYPATALDGGGASPWLAVESTWSMGPIDLDGLRFAPGDRMVEYFSPRDPYNVFAVFAPIGQLRGWYANVTYPTALDWPDGRPRLTWHDLYVDLVLLPDGRLTIRDEDELAASGLATRDPALHAAILATRDRLRDFARRRDFPFHERDRDHSARK